jgi:hypothetical protein
MKHRRYIRSPKPKTGASVPILWLVFAAGFFSLAGLHFVWSGNSIPPFELSTRPYESDMSGIEVDMSILGSSVDQPLEDFIQEFNAHLEKVNHLSGVSHLAGAVGYLAAGFTALFSLFLARSQRARKTSKETIG